MSTGHALPRASDLHHQLDGPQARTLLHPTTLLHCTSCRSVIHLQRGGLGLSTSAMQPSASTPSITIDALCRVVALTRSTLATKSNDTTRSNMASNGIASTTTAHSPAATAPDLRSIVSYTSGPVGHTFTSTPPPSGTQSKLCSPASLRKQRGLPSVSIASVRVGHVHQLSAIIELCANITTWSINERTTAWAIVGSRMRLHKISTSISSMSITQAQSCCVPRRAASMWSLMGRCGCIIISSGSIDFERRGDIVGDGSVGRV